jgi:phosphoribosyl 1,2-cyclic phosphate phosphodiesterase
MTEKKDATLLFLGTGSSMGIPVIGCHCSVCNSSSKFNKRLRPSALISVENKKYVIDTTPDFRIQALTYGIESLDGVFYTHAHHDHTAGIDELRVFYLKSQTNMPCLLSKETADDLKKRFSYILKNSPEKRGLVARLKLHVLENAQGLIDFEGLCVQYMSYEQLGMGVLGFRFGNLAYVSDIKEYSESIFRELEGVETLVLSALRYEESKLHLSIDEAVSFAKKVGAKMTWLTHIAHEVEHESTNRLLPDNVQLAYDGLIVNFQAIIVP